MPKIIKEWHWKKKAKLPKNVAASIEQDGATLGDENRNIMNKMFNGTTHTFAENTPSPPTPTFILKELVLHTGRKNTRVQKKKKKNVAIFYDEMKMKSNLLCSRISGKMVGFTEKTFKTFQEKLERKQTTHNNTF